MSLRVLRQLRLPMSHTLVLVPPVASTVKIRHGSRDKLALDQLGHNAKLISDDALTLSEEYVRSFGRVASCPFEFERTSRTHINPLYNHWRRKNAKLHTSHSIVGNEIRQLHEQLPSVDQ
jgi:hypothetical protein